MAQPLGVIHILVSRRSPEDRLPQHTDKRALAILSGTRIRELFAHHRVETERVVKFTIGEQTGVRNDDRTAKLEHQPPVEIEPDPS
jgi:hypothetical protein